MYNKFLFSFLYAIIFIFPIRLLSQRFVLKAKILSSANDTFRIAIMRDLNQKDSSEKKLLFSKNGEFSFESKIDRNSIIQMELSNKLYSKKINGYYYIEPGDSINIVFSDDSISFSGRGSSKWDIQYRAMNEYKYRYNKYPSSIVKSNLETYPIFSAFTDSIIDYHTKLIESHKGQISLWALSILKTDILSYDEYWRSVRYFLLVRSYSDNFKLLDSLYTSTILNSPLCKIRPNDINISSVFYPLFLQQKNHIEIRRLNRYKFFNFDSFVHQYYSYVNENFDGNSREVLIQSFFEKYIKNPDAKEYILTCIKEYLDESHPDNFRYKIKYMYDKINELSSGISAPIFNLIDSSGKYVSLDRFEGKVVLLDFWYTGCSGCARQTPFLKKVEEKYINNGNVVFINISIDNNVNVWKKSLQRGLYTGLKSICLNANKSKVLTDYSVSSYPALYLIGKEGNIVTFVNPIQDDFSVTSLVNKIDSILLN